MADETLKSYEDIPYDSHSFPQSHPNSVATVATLFGMTPQPMTDCRVLELGCAGGFNLIPMAATLPGSRFVGVDLSSRQIADGLEAVKALGLTNVDLRAMSILDVGDDFGRFDYVICHGVYSWVPAEVREKILQVCSRNLAPDGVAYVSYNCYPGWGLPLMIREMMLYHTKRFTDPEKRIEQARALLEYLEMGTIDPKSTYARLLKEEADLLRRTPKYYLYHEHLEVVNEPVYFYEFAERAAAHGLQYVWESYQGDRAGYLRGEVKTTLDRLSTDVIRREQNIDFLINRRFRQSLLCHDNITLDRSLPSDRIAAFSFLGWSKPQSARVDCASPGKETFRAPGGESISVDSPVMKAALACLHEVTPRLLSFDELCDAVRARLEEDKSPVSPPEAALRAEVTGLLRQCVWPRLVAIQLNRMGFTHTAGERPVASAVARYQAKQSAHVTNLAHHTVVVGKFEQKLLPLLNGQMDRRALLEHLVGLAEKNEIQVTLKDQTVRDKSSIRTTLAQQLDTCLKKLTAAALLVE